MMARRPALSTGEAAALASCHATTILRAIERGELHAYRLGPHGDHRIEAAALAKWLRPAHDPEEPAP
jgi:excisionase family DNA binding protein